MGLFYPQKYYFNTKIENGIQNISPEALYNAITLPVLKSISNRALILNAEHKQL